jgi:diaminopimelate decarboxylase
VSPFHSVNGVLHAEAISLPDLAARFGTPSYIYSRAALESAYRAYDAAFAAHPHLVCYAVKANSNLAVLNLFARLGSGFDIVSGGELRRVVAAGGDTRKVLFSGVGKTREEMRYALEHDILCFNVESAGELRALNEVAGAMGRRAPVSLRVNPHVDPKIHPYVATGIRSSKFGIAYDQARSLYRDASRLPAIALEGIDFHVGSTLMDTAPAIEAAEKVLALVDQLASDGIALRHVDIGGGLGIPYRGEAPVDLQAFADRLVALLSGRPEKLLLEPGRFLVGNAGVLLTRVLYLKHGETRNFAVVDAAMNDLMRPALYDAHHQVVAVAPHAGIEESYDVVGPICESGDFLCRDRNLTLAENDLLVLMQAGAYGMAMSSNYNTRGRACEIMVDREEAHEIKVREQAEDLFAGEKLLPP